MKNEKQLALLIKESINTYPGGICFARMDGRPILVNQIFNELIVRLTGHTVMDVHFLWEELLSWNTWNGCRKIVKNWDVSPMDTENTLGVEMPDGEIWQLRRSELIDGSKKYIQLEAVNVTDLYKTSNELLESNQKLRKLYQRQCDLIEDIVQVNRERELLHAKMKIHTDLGQCIIATKKALRQKLLPQKAKELIHDWNQSIRNFSNISEEHTQQESMETELLKVAKMIGCQILIMGERPTERKVQQLLFSAVREALTNAVRHANANELKVSCKKKKYFWHVEITDNGTVPAGRIVESGGLGSLRKRLEQEGAILQILQEDGVKMIVDIPILSDEEVYI